MILLKGIAKQDMLYQTTCFIQDSDHLSIALITLHKSNNSNYLNLTHVYLKIQPVPRSKRNLSLL